MYNVNIYYSEEEVHDAFKNYYNVVKQDADVHIFTKNDLPFSLYGEEKNVFLHSQGSLWDRLKAWMAGENKFEQQFSQLNISKENSKRYCTLINKGGIIVVSKDEAIDPLINETNESKLALEEDITPPLNSSEQNDGDPPLEGIIEDLQTTTEITPSFDANSQNNEPSNNPIEPNTLQQNLYIADVSTKTNHVPSTNYPQYEYYEDGPRKHNLYSEKLQQLLNENEQIIQDVLNSNTKNKDTFDSSGNSESNDYFLNEASKQLEDTIRSLTSENQNGELQLDNLVHFVQQLSADDTIRTFTQNVLSNLNVPTDSTESVLDNDLQAILEKLKSDDVRKLFPFSPDDINIISSELKDSTTGDNSHIIEVVDDNPLLDESSHAKDDVMNTNEQTGNDSQ